MKYHQNWNKAKQRFTDLWENKPTTIPYIGITTQKENLKDYPPAPESDEDFWLDSDWIVKKFFVDLENNYWLGEIMPSNILMASWLVSLGGKPVFNRNTIWFEQYDHIDFGKPSPFRHNPKDPWFLKYKKLLTAVAKAAGKDNFGICAAGGLPVNDLLAMHMGMNFLFAVMDHPEWLREAIIQGAEDMIKVKLELMELGKKYAETWGCGAGWLSIWAPEPFLRIQSDISCMLSPDAFEQFILPEFEIYGKKFPLWYHLDGGNAKQHLPILLSLPYIKVIQYTPTPNEPENGIEHVEFYKQVQRAGKIVHISVPAQRITEAFLQELDPSKILISTTTESLGQAKDLLSRVSKWCG